MGILRVSRLEDLAFKKDLSPEKLFALISDFLPFELVEEKGVVYLSYEGVHIKPYFSTDGIKYYALGVPHQFKKICGALNYFVGNYGGQV